MPLRRSMGRNEISRSLRGEPTSRRFVPKSTRARSFTRMSRPSRFHHELRRAAPLEGAVAQEGVVGLDARAVPRSHGEHESAVAKAGPGDPCEDPVLQVDDREEVAVGEHRLRPPEKEEAAFVQGEVESLEDPLLRLRVEVHEGVAAGQQVDARDRRVLDEVVPPEDDPAPQLSVEHVAVVDAFEVPLAQLGGHGLDVPIGVGRGPAATQGVVVEVGGVDLHPLAERGRSHRLDEDHRDRERLLPGGATRDPNPDRVLGSLRLEQSRHHEVVDVIPRRRDRGRTR